MLLVKLLLFCIFERQHIVQHENTTKLRPLSVSAESISFSVQIGIIPKVRKRHKKLITLCEKRESKKGVQTFRTKITEPSKRSTKWRY